jgi:hypothetical protein
LTRPDRCLTLLAGRAFPAALLILLSLSLSGCAPIVGGDQTLAPEGSSLPLAENVRIGQTFTARHSGLAAMEVYLRPLAQGSGEIELALRSGPRDGNAIAASTLPVAAVTAPGFYRFAFDPRAGAWRDYFADLTIRGGGSVAVAMAPGASYLDGALYQNGQALDAQLAFRLAYQPQAALAGLAGEVAGWLGLVLAAVFLFVLPGWALLAALWPGWDDLPWPARTGVAAGLSLGLYPVLMLWTGLPGLRLGPVLAWLPTLSAAAYLAWRGRRWRPGLTFASVHARLRNDGFLPDLVFLLLAAAIIAVRFYAVRGLDVPLWGDSVQHSMIVQLMSDHGGLFNSWQPYAEMQSFTYHFGFHAGAASLLWLTGLDAPQATLWMGQILNVLAALTLYPLAWKMGGNRWAGVAAVLVAGLLSAMPMTYTDWGRYTQLAGQVALPAVVYLCWERLDGNGRGWRALVLVGLGLGGLALIHYRVLIFAVAFLACLTVVGILTGRWRRAIGDFVAYGAGGGLLFLPWFLHLYGGRILASLTKQVTTPAAQVSEWGTQYNALGELTAYLPAAVWVAFALAIGWGLCRRNTGAMLFGLWSGVMLAVANPSALGLPGAGVINNFAVFIAAYLPAAVLIGGAVGWLAGLRWPVGVTWKAGAIAAALLVCSLWGAPKRLGDMRIAESALVTRPDLRAAAWIRANTPADARFLVNAFFAFGDGVVVGSDGGWWLPLLARRASTLPPINYATEQGPRQDYVQWVNSLPAEVLAKDVTHPAVLAMLKERGVTHVYIGQQQGRVNYTGPVIEPAKLLADAHFRPMYHEDRVWVFAVVP